MYVCTLLQMSELELYVCNRFGNVLFQIGEVQRLRDGDRVIFGHKNGYKVKVGETAQQPDSEFQFVVSLTELQHDEILACSCIFLFSLCSRFM